MDDENMILIKKSMIEDGGLDKSYASLVGLKGAEIGRQMTSVRCDFRCRRPSEQSPRRPLLYFA
jgi:hypothetical protein